MLLEAISSAPNQPPHPPSPALTSAAQPSTPVHPTWEPPMTTPRSDYLLSQLDILEAESIHMMREVAAEFERPVLLFSGGKDSIVMLALAERAFWPARIPFPVMHVDTGHNFPEVLALRDRRGAAARPPPPPPPPPPAPHPHPSALSCCR